MRRLLAGLLLIASVPGCATPAPQQTSVTPVIIPLHGLDIPVIAQRGQGPDQLSQDVAACRGHATAYAALQRDPTFWDGLAAAVAVTSRATITPNFADPEIPSATADPTNAAGVAFKRCMTARGYEVRWAPTLPDTGGADRSLR